jgi:type I restriction enzyme S subunit
LADVMGVERRRIDPDANTSYAMLGIYSHGKGTFRKPAILGADAPQAGIYRVRAGDFVLNITFAWEGALALIRQDDDGWYVSGRFPTFVCDPKRCDPTYLLFYFRSRAGRAQLEAVSPGSAGRNRVLNTRRFLDLSVPMPGLVEQRAVVARLDAFMRGHQRVIASQRTVADKVEAMARSVFNRGVNHAQTVAMRQLVKIRPLDVAVEPDHVYRFAGVYSFGRGVFPGARKSGRDFAYRQLTTLRTGDFVYPKLMAWEGALGTVPTECDGLVVSPEFPVFEVDTEEVPPEVLDMYFRSPTVWPRVAELSTGTNVRRRRLHPTAFLRFEMPLPGKDVQEQVKEIWRRAHLIRRLQADSAAALAAVLPAAIEQEFPGAST